MADVYQGHCLCGAIELEVQGAPRVEICHCDMCRRWHGGTALAVMFENGVEITKGQDQIASYQSSDWAERTFCRKCGTSLYYHLIGSEMIHSAQTTSEAPRITSAEMFERFEKYQAEQQKND
jgi:hypothetical protein